jgi:RNA methyltransferase, TrmH family
MRPKPSNPRAGRPTSGKHPRKAPQASSPNPSKPSLKPAPSGSPAQRARASERVPLEETQKVYGIAAVLAVVARRPEQVLSIAHTPAARKLLASALREAARRRIAYREVNEEELTRIAGSLHHEGVCVLAREPAAPDLETLARRTEPRGLIVALDGVQNPHNIGAILRSAAFFGAAGLVLAGQRGARAEGLPPAALRVAEGGAEHVGVLRVSDLLATLQKLAQAGLSIVGADAHAERSLTDLRWPPRTVLVLGSEADGLAREIREMCHVTVRVMGRGALESLNVSVAAGVMLASHAGSLA